MSTAELIEHDITKSPIRYSVTDATIAELSEKYLPLKIDGIDDKAGFDVVHSARMDVKNLRVSVEKTRKELKAGALEYGRKVDGEAKRITALLEPIEKHLTAEEDAVKAEKERIKQEAEEKRQHALQERLDQLTAVELMMSPTEVEAMDDEAFASLLAEATANHEAKLEAERKAEEERQRLRELADTRREQLAAVNCFQATGILENMTDDQFDAELKLATKRHEADLEEKAKQERERAELEKQRAAQEAEQRRLDEERRKAEAAQREEEERLQRERDELEAAKREQERQEREKQEREAAAERARQAERERIEREAEEQRQREEAEAAEQARLEALRPDREKLLAYADALESLDVPEVSPEAQSALVYIDEAVVEAVRRIRNIIDAL